MEVGVMVGKIYGCLPDVTLWSLLNTIVWTPCCAKRLPLAHNHNSQHQPFCEIEVSRCRELIFYLENNGSSYSIKEDIDHKENKDKKKGCIAGRERQEIEQKWNYP